MSCFLVFPTPHVPRKTFLLLVEGHLWVVRAGVGPRVPVPVPRSDVTVVHGDYEVETPKEGFCVSG